MSPRKKRAVSVAFLFGLMYVFPPVTVTVITHTMGESPSNILINCAISSACVGSSLKIYYAVRLLHTKNNQSYQIYLLGVCTLPEIGGGIIAGCLPSLPRFFKHILQTPLLSTYKTYFSKLISASSRWSSSSTVAQSPGNSAAVDIEAAKKSQFDDQYPLTSVVSCPGSETVHVSVTTTHSTQECTVVSSNGKEN